jgi:hypothetical protein
MASTTSLRFNLSQQAWVIATLQEFHRESDRQYRFVPAEQREEGTVATLFCDGVMVDEYLLRRVSPVYPENALQNYKKKLLFRRINREYPLEPVPVPAGPRTEIEQFVADQWKTLTGDAPKPQYRRPLDAPSLETAHAIALRELESEATASS